MQLTSTKDYQAESQIYGKFCKKLKVYNANKLYINKPEAVLENERRKRHYHLVIIVKRKFEFIGELKKMRKMFQNKRCLLKKRIF